MTTLKRPAKLAKPCPIPEDAQQGDIIHTRSGEQWHFEGWFHDGDAAAGNNGVTKFWHRDGTKYIPIGSSAAAEKPLDCTRFERVTSKPAKPERYRPLTDLECTRIWAHAMLNGPPGKTTVTAIRAAHRAGAMGLRGPAGKRGWR